MTLHGVAGVGLYFCKGTQDEKLDVMFDILSQKSEAISESDECIEGLFCSMLEFAIVHWDQYYNKKDMESAYKFSYT